MKRFALLLMVCFLMAISTQAVFAGSGDVWTKSIPIQTDVPVMVDINWGQIILQDNKGAKTSPCPCSASTITGTVPLYVGANVPVIIEVTAVPLKSKNSIILTRWHTKLDTPDSAFGDWKKAGDIENLGSFTTPICRKYIIEWEAVCGDICAQEAGHYDGMLTCKVTDP